MKLFKKVAAAVLAGVMALSMVACGTTTPTVPEKPVDETKSAEQQIMDKLNEYVAAYAVSTDTKAVTVENELKAQAQAVLDAIAAGTVNKAGTTVEFDDAKSQGALYDAITAAKKKGKLYFSIAEMKAENEFVNQHVTANYASVTLPTEYKSSQLTDLKATLKWNSGRIVVTDSVVRNQLKVNRKIGVASKEINGKTYVMFIVADSQ